MKILVVSNCQSYGLANSMLQLAPSVVVTAQPGQRLRNKDLVDGIDDTFDAAFVMKEYEKDAKQHCKMDRLLTMPSVYFDRFHPDVVSVSSAGELVKSDTDTYHSLIGLAAYLAGRDVRGAHDAFNADTFKYAGYLQGWNEARDQLFADFDECGLDVRADFLRWMRKGCFMHSHNHPKIDVLFSTARLMLAKADVPMLPVPECLLPDNLLNASVMPVYPEIAEPLGFAGSYIFKRHGTQRTINLLTYLQKTYRIYDQHDRTTLTCTPAKAALLKRMVEYLS